MHDEEFREAGKESCDGQVVRGDGSLKGLQPEDEVSSLNKLFAADTVNTAPSIDRVVRKVSSSTLPHLGRCR